MKRLILIVVILSLLFNVGNVALASDTFDALYTGIVKVTNNSTATTNVSVNFTASSADFISGGFMNSTANNTAIIHSAGADAVYMPGFGDSNPWALFVPSIGTNNILNNTLFMGGPTAMNAKIRYFPASGGMTTPDSASLEIGDNFTIEQSGWIDTDAGADKNLVYKANSFRTHVSETVSGNITTSILGQAGAATETLRPDGVGSETNIANVVGASHWEATNDSSDATYVWTIGAAYERDLYTTDNHSTSSGIINSVTIYFRFRTNNVVGSAFAKPVLRTHSTTYEGNEVNHGTTAWTTYNQVYNNNPNTSVPWLFDEIDALEIGVTLKESTGNQAQCSEVYIIVSYGAEIVVSSASVSGVSTGEHTITTSTDNTSLFLGIGIDTVDADYPVTENLTFNNPLWHIESSGSPFTTKDIHEFTCTVTDAVWSSDGYTFGGGDDKITISDNATLDFTDNLTIEAWVYHSNETSDFIVGKRAQGSDDAFGLSVGSAPDYPILEIFVSNARIFVTGDTELTLDSWEYVVGTYNQTDLRVYLNGQLDCTPTAETGNIDVTVDDLTIGWGYSDVFSWLGQIGEVRIYDKALTPTEILYNYNATKWKYDSSDEDFHYNLLDAAVPDHPDTWTFLENDAMPYMERQRIWIDAVLQQDITWEYASIFTDASGESHDITPTFRSTSSDPDVSAVLVNFRPISEAKAPAYTAEVSATGWITTSVNQSGAFTTTTNATYPGSDITVAVTTAGGVPIQLLELIMAGVIMLALSLFISWIMRTNREGSLIFKILAISAGLGIMLAVSIVDNWILYLFLMISIAIAMAASQRTFTGTGNAGNNIIGFLSMAFVGMTMINRILEGRFIQSADVDILRNTLAFQPFQVFGLFTIPVPNTNFLLNGIPALLRWDYSFFGGNAQIFQYMLYSITAVVSFMLFVLVFGAIYQMFSRGR